MFQELCYFVKSLCFYIGDFKLMFWQAPHPAEHYESLRQAITVWQFGYICLVVNVSVWMIQRQLVIIAKQVSRLVGAHGFLVVSFIWYGMARQWYAGVSRIKWWLYFIILCSGKCLQVKDAETLMIILDYMRLRCLDAKFYWKPANIDLPVKDTPLIIASRRLCESFWRFATMSYWYTWSC